MRRLMIVALSASVALSGCGGGQGGAGNGTAAAGGGESQAPVKRKPGSWSSKIEIVKLEGPDVKPGVREQMQQMFNMMGSMSVCMTQEMLDKEDVSKNLEQSAGSKDCTFDKRDMTGSTVSFSAVCDRDGKKVRMNANGTSSATSQDITLKIEPLNAAGTPEGVMEMHVTSTHNGECKPGDITPPTPGTAPGAPGAPKP